MTTIETQGRSSMPDSTANSNAHYSPITPELIEAQAQFVSRHIGPRDTDIDEMLKTLGVSDMEAFVSQVVPSDIRGTHRVQALARPASDR